MDSKLHRSVLEALTKAASQNPEFLKVAENQLIYWEKKHGFYTVLLNIAFDHEIDINIRWMAVLCAKNGIYKHWTENIADDEKNAIRQKMLHNLNEPVSQIAFQLPVLIAKVARYDFTYWGDLFPTLLTGIQSTDELYHQTALLTVYRVIKTLYVKECFLQYETNEAECLTEVAEILFSTILHQWINYSKSYLDTVQSDIIKTAPILESALFSLKVLKHLAGFQDISKPDVSKLLLLIFEQFKPFLECRLFLKNAQHNEQMCEKYLVLLIKVLHCFQKKDPSKFVPFIHSTLEFFATYLLKNDFQDYLFEGLNVQFLNLVNQIILEEDYFSPQYKDDETIKDIAQRAEGIIMNFFTPCTMREIFHQLVSRYLVLSPKDIYNWKNDPEGFAADEYNRSWKVCLRPSAVQFFSSLMKTFREILAPLILEAAKKININDSNEILKREAVYLVMGLSCLDSGDIDFEQFSNDVLLPELRNKSDGYYVIRRRVVWLMGEWSRGSFSSDSYSIVYEIVMHCLGKQENLVVRLTAASSLEKCICYYLFIPAYFLPFVNAIFPLLYELLVDVKEFDLKVLVLSAIKYVLQKMGLHLQHIAKDLVFNLFQLWHKSEEQHYMLKCEIVACLAALVRCLGAECESLYDWLLSLIDLCTDVTQPLHVHLLEDALDLWNAIITHTSTCSSDLMKISSRLLPLLYCNNEMLFQCVNLIKAYILLAPEEYLKNFGQELIKAINHISTLFKQEDIYHICKMVEHIFCLFPGEIIQFQPFLSSLLNLLLEHQDSDSSFSVTTYMNLLSFVILNNQTLFLKLLQEKADKFQKNVNMILGELLKMWLHSFSIKRRICFRLRSTHSYNWKFMGLALSRLLAFGLEAVYDNFCAILHVLVKILDGVTNKEKLDIFLQEGGPEGRYRRRCMTTAHDKRELEIQKNHPAFCISLRHYLYDQMKSLEQSVGSSKFKEMLSNVDSETQQKIQYYLEL